MIKRSICTGSRQRLFPIYVAGALVATTQYALAVPRRRGADFKVRVRVTAIDGKEAAQPTASNSAFPSTRKPRKSSPARLEPLGGLDQTRHWIPPVKGYPNSYNRYWQVVVGGYQSRSRT